MSIGRGRQNSAAIMPTYEYLCEKHGVFEVFQSIKDPALKTHGHFNVGPFIHPPQEQRVGLCVRPVKRLISGGCGVIMDPDKCYETLPPTGDGKVREVKSDLPRSRAKLIGIPRDERKEYEKKYY